MSGNSPNKTTPTIDTTAVDSVTISDTVQAAVETVPRRLSCFFKTQDTNGEFIRDLSDSPEIFLLQEKGKKSSFLLELEDTSTFYTVQKPPHVIIEHESPDTSSSTFFLGGFQMVSTAKTVEVYLTDLEGKETYLTTSKGIPFNKEDATASWYKAICVVPGGPRPISRLRIKLLSIRPTDATTAKLQFMKLTARISESPSSMAAATSPASVSFSQPPYNVNSAPNESLNGGSCKKSVVFAPLEVPEDTRNTPLTKPSPSGVSQSDLAAAMAGIAFMTRSTEKGIEEALNDQTERMEKYFGSCFLRMEQQIQFLQRHLIVQQQLIQESNEVMTKQQEVIQDQSSQLETLAKQQENMNIRLQSLQADMSIVRYQRFESSKKSNNEVTKDVERISALEVKSPLAMEQIGTKVRDIDQEDEHGANNDQLEDLESDGIVDHYTEVDGNASDYHLQNIQLRNLIQKTAREIDEQPVGCRPVHCGPLMDPKPVACGSFPDDAILFKGMMLTDEEIRYQEMSRLRASRDDDAISPQLQPNDADHAFQEQSAEEEDPDETEQIEEQNDACINIEVTLMDDAEEEQCGENDDPDEGDLGEDFPLQENSGDVFGYNNAKEDTDGTATAVYKTDVDDAMVLLEEKKEMEFLDAPSMRALMMSGEKAAEIGTTACTLTDSLPCHPKSPEAATL
jgi:hypothetical protein